MCVHQCAISKYSWEERKNGHGQDQFKGKVAYIEKMAVKTLSVNHTIKHIMQRDTNLNCAAFYYIYIYICKHI